MYSLLDALIPKTRQQVLAAALLHPDKWWYGRDLARHIDATPSHVHKELHALLEAGILESMEEGKQVYFRADTACPIYHDLLRILQKTAGLCDVIKEALKPLSKKITLSFVYGSIAKQTETTASDIDLMVVGDTDLEELSKRLRKAESYLLRPINPTVFKVKDFKSKIAKKDHFLTSLIASEKLFIIGNNDDLERAFK